MKQNNFVHYQQESKKVQIKTDLTKHLVMNILSELSCLRDFEVIDLKEVKKVDSSALAFLIEIHKTNKRKLKVINPPIHLLQLGSLVDVEFLFE